MRANLLAATRDGGVDVKERAIGIEDEDLVRGQSRAPAIWRRSDPHRRGLIVRDVQAVLGTDFWQRGRCSPELTYQENDAVDSLVGQSSFELLPSDTTLFPSNRNCLILGMIELTAL